MKPTCILRKSYGPGALLVEHPPQMRHPGKQLALELTCPPGAAHAGTIELTRWAATLPLNVELAATDIAAVIGVYDYAGGDAGVWHVNFADPQLFVAYGSRLLAQDELQCLEHPALCSLREAMVAAGLPARTAEDGVPTPVLVAGVERRCALDTSTLYGNRFAAASPDVVRAAVRLIDPPTRSNLIAIAAPTGGPGPYWRRELDRILVTAYTGFAAAVAESRRMWPDAAVEIRTGFWGCGAFGGSRHLMTLMQLLAARLAGVARVRFYTFDQRGKDDFDAGAAALGDVLCDLPPGTPLGALLECIDDLDYEWGVGNGT